jgi:hypothetical protein
MNMRPSPLDAQVWMNGIFASKAASHGAVVRRKARDIERFVGRAAFAEELRRRGFQAIENGGQVVIFCNREPVRPFE